MRHRDIAVNPRCGSIDRLMRMKEAPPDMPAPPDWGDKIMYAQFASGAVKFGASDGRPGTPNVDGNVSLSIMTRDEAEATRVFNELAGRRAVPIEYKDVGRGPLITARVTPV